MSKPLNFGPSQQLVDAELQKVLEQMRNLGFAARIKFLLERWRAAPYLLSAVGDGENSEFDQFPLYRIDKFDCLSFVALVLVLSHAQDIKEVHTLWRRLNYSGEINFLKRNHFMETQFLPALTNLNWASNITPSFVHQTINLTIDVAAWIENNVQSLLRVKDLLQDAMQTKIAALQHAAAHINTQTIQLDYVATQTLLDDIDGFKNLMPQFSLLAFVNPDADFKAKLGTELAITHCGFVVKDADGLTLHHASQTLQQVVAVDFVNYCRERSAQVAGFGFCVYALNIPT